MKPVLNHLDVYRLLTSICLFVRMSSTQNCSLISEQELFVLMQDYYHPSTDEGQPNLIIMDYNITCLSHSILQDHYQYTTVSVKYLNLPQGFTQNEIFTAIIDIGCSMENEWDADVLGNTAFKWSSPTLNNTPRSDCALCNGDIYGADIATHCVACHENCSIPGTLQGCYEAGDQQHCCLVYLNGQCSNSCEDNQTANESFVCENKVEEGSVEPTSTASLSLTYLTTQNFPTSTMSVSTYSTGSNNPSPAITPVNSKDFPTLIHLTMFLSGITCLVTVIVSISITTTIIVCACCFKCKKKSKSSSHSPVETSSSIGTVSEYVEPLTSPFSNTERSLTIQESLSMHLNSSYSRGSGRYFSATARIPPAQYEDPDLVLDKQRSFAMHPRRDTGQNEHSYVTIIA